MNIKDLLGIGTEVTEFGYILTAVYALILWLCAKLVLRAYRKMTEAMIERKGKTAATTYSFLNNIVKVAVYALIVYLILIQFRAFKSLGNVVLGTSSVIGVAVALAAQESMSNIVGGFFLSLYQPFRVNDLISLPDKNISGRIKEIGMRHTVIVTFANTEVIVPNSIMNSTIIENKDIGHKYNNYLTFSISYSSNIDQAMEIIRNQALAHPLLLDIRSKQEKEKGVSAANVVVIDLGAYSVDLRLSFYTKDAANGFSAVCDLRKSVKEAFDQEGIVIPFPTREIIQN